MEQEEPTLAVPHRLVELPLVSVRPDTEHVRRDDDVNTNGKPPNKLVTPGQRLRDAETGIR